MNERIKELAEQAKEFSHWTNDGHIANYRINPEKFAQLIVRECIDILDDENDGGIDTKSVRLAMIRMKKHFGVE